MKTFRLISPIAFLILLMYPTLQAQESPKRPLADRFFLGGNLGLQFGNLTFVDLSPLVGYKITEKLHAGIGATYIYYKYKDAYLKYETNIYGGRVFGRYYPLENLFAHAEYEVLNMEVPETVNFPGTTSTQYVRDNINSLLVGGGYALPIGGSSSVIMMLLFNVIEEEYSPYQNPIIRIGFNAGF